ncbi:MAG: TonB-dependent receptor, partial [Bacteroidales bacterium]|nr:TonB-dependent receptor [Bacteroidales bacterium]
NPSAMIWGMRGSNGVISIFAKRGWNQNNVDNTSPLPSSIKAYSPLGYQQPAEFYAPKYETDAQRRNSRPDLRTTIHWQPVVLIDHGGAASFEFYAADRPFSYTVTIEGVANNGRMIQKQEKIRF